MPRSKRSIANGRMTGSIVPVAMAPAIRRPAPGLRQSQDQPALNYRPGQAGCSPSKGA
jgi:hypothetical protein